MRSKNSLKGWYIDRGQVRSLFAGRYEIIEELGTGGMGRSDDINSGDSEIYICLAPRPHLDGKYTVFGQLTEGYDTLEKISNVAVEEKWEGPDKKLAMRKPIKPVVIERAWLEERDR